MMKLKCSRQFPKRKIINFLFIFLPILLVFVSCQKTAGNEIVAFGDSAKSDTLKLVDIIDFDWDEIWIAYPSMHDSCLIMMRNRGIDIVNFYDSKDLRNSLWSEYLEIMIFISNRKLVHYCFSPVINSRGGN